MVGVPHDAFFSKVEGIEWVGTSRQGRSQWDQWTREVPYVMLWSPSSTMRMIGMLMRTYVRLRRAKPHNPLPPRGAHNSGHRALPARPQRGSRGWGAIGVLHHVDHTAGHPAITWFAWYPDWADPIFQQLAPAVTTTSYFPA